MALGLSFVENFLWLLRIGNFFLFWELQLLYPESSNMMYFNYQPNGSYSELLASANDSHTIISQNLLNEVVNVQKALKLKPSMSQSLNNSKDNDDASKNDGEQSNPDQESTAVSAAEISPSERQELQNKITKLLAMLDEARPLLNRALETGEIGELTDPKLEKRYSYREMFQIIEAAAACVRPTTTLRPRMS